MNEIYYKPEKQKKNGQKSGHKLPHVSKAIWSQKVS